MTVTGDTASEGCVLHSIAKNKLTFLAKNQHNVARISIMGKLISSCRRLYRVIRTTGNIIVEFLGGYK